MQHDSVKNNYQLKAKVKVFKPAVSVGILPADIFGKY